LCQLISGRDNIANKVGPLWVGPFEFTVNSEKYSTDSIMLDIHPPLPDKVKNGIWIRLANFKDHSYLIVEQRIANEWTQSNDENSFTISTSSEGLDFAELNQQLFEQQNLNISSSRTASNSQVVDEEDAFGSGTVQYKISTYKFSKEDDFKGFNLTNEYFENLPEGYELNHIEIN